MATDILVMGCVSQKLARPAAARDLYTSALWLRRRRYAEASGLPWVIFSAEYAIVAPDAVVGPYDRSLNDVSPADLRTIGEQAVQGLEERFGRLEGKTIEVHAGEAYVAALAPELLRREANLVRPLQGLRLGEQLRWYDARAGGPAPQPTPNVEPVNAAGGSAPVGEVAIVGLERLGPFSYRWPTGVESFERGWNLLVNASGRTYRMRHGIGRRAAYGRDRARTVTWVGGPKVEGVGTDDYDESGMLVSMLRVEGGRMVDYQGELPAGYAGFEVVRFAEEIVAPRSRRKLAVKLGEDDLVAWSRHALLRVSSQSARKSKPPKGTPWSPPVGPRLSPPPSPDQRGVANALLLYGATNPLNDHRGETTFTENPDANTFVTANPFAFLLGVIFDQGVKAERAWGAPYLLSQRLGHLDPGRMASEPDRVAVAVATPPKLHRYMEKMPAWLVSAARRVSNDYGGDAGRLWGDEPTAIELQRRLDAFDGIGQKKAAMAVAILARDLGTSIKELGGNDIAYDVHIRRVFLRTGLSHEDDLDEMLAVARALSPTQPALLDLPAWHIGRTWCRAGVPTCPECPLLPVCPRLVERADAVTGA